MAKIRTSGYATRRSSFVTAFIGDCDYEAMPANGKLQTAIFSILCGASAHCHRDGSHPWLPYRPASSRVVWLWKQGHDMGCALVTGRPGSRRLRQAGCLPLQIGGGARTRPIAPPSQLGTWNFAHETLVRFDPEKRAVGAVGGGDAELRIRDDGLNGCHRA